MRSFLALVGLVAFCAGIAGFSDVEAGNSDTPAKKLFGGKSKAADMPPAAIGSYARGCLAGGESLPPDGDHWQVMRLSRNRNWGHPELISYLKELADKVSRVAMWQGLLIGDIAQPRGGPMLTGHASHQIGLDADIWLNPAPKRRLSRIEREKISARSMLASDKISVDPKIWTKAHFEVIKAAAEDDRVARIFVHPAIKKALCRDAGSNRRWLRKIRPWWGHHYHFHVRLSCPENNRECKPQKPPPVGDGCGSELSKWLEMVRPRKVTKGKGQTRHKKPLTLAQLPKRCRDVLAARDAEESGSVENMAERQINQQNDTIPLPVPSPRRLRIPTVGKAEPARKPRSGS